MKNSAIVAIGIFILIVTAFVIFALWWILVRKTLPPTIPHCVAVQKDTYCLSNGWLAAKEITNDATVPSPNTVVKLDSFGASSGQAPWCVPSFYAIRLVDDNGNFGPLSEWSEPVVASPTAIPGGCASNQITLELQNPSAIDQKIYYANVHRQDGVLDQNSDGNIVGMFLDGVNFFVDDPLSNPNGQYQEQTCTGC